MSDITREYYEDHVGRIGEMGSLESMTDDGLTVPAEFLEKVKSADDDPMFITVEVESGMSRSKLNWLPEHVKQVVDMVNKDRMAGNLGHPLIEKEAYERDFPEPHVVWVAAKMREAGGQAVGKFKGYVLKGAKAREYLKLGLIDGVSWFGNTTMRPRREGGYDVVKFEPETLDFARKGRSGMNTRVLSLAGEMASKGGLQVEPREIAALSPAEVKEHAPLVFKAIQDEGKTELETKVGEQTAEIAALEPEVEITKKVRELLGLAEGENPIEKLSNMIEKLEEGATSEIKTFVKGLVEKKVKTQRGQALLSRMLGEMHTEYADKPLTDDLKKEIEDAFEKKIEDDQDIKVLVGEMGGWAETEGAGETRERGSGTVLGGQSRAGRARREGNLSDAAGTRRHGSVTITKRKLS